MRGPHRFIAGIFFLSVIIVGYFFWFQPHRESDKPIHIPIASQPTLGLGEGVSLIVFEEPLCPHCLELNLEVMPKIKSKFIDTHKISYTVIPVSFLLHSMQIAEAWLAAYYNQVPPSNEDFFTYLRAYYVAQNKRTLQGAHSPWTVKQLADLLQETLPSADRSKFTQDLLAGDYASKIQKNTDDADHTLPSGLITPAIFVNGRRVSQWRHEKLEQAIEKALMSESSQEENNA